MLVIGGTAYYLPITKDYVARIDKDTREIVSFLNPDLIDWEKNIVGYKLYNGEHYVKSESGVKKYFVVKNQELIEF